MRPRTENGKRLLTISEVARWLGTTPWQVRCLLWDGKLPYVWLGRRFLIDIHDLDALVESLKEREVAP